MTRAEREVMTLYRLLRHPRTPWHVRLIAACAVGYLFSPIQLIPSIIPVIGQLDDVCVLGLGARLVRTLAPPDLLADCASGPPPPRGTLGLIAGMAVLGAVLVAVLVHATG